MEDRELLWTYAGEIKDPATDPFTQSVWTCATCSALVHDSALRNHERWHLVPIQWKEAP